MTALKAVATGSNEEPSAEIYTVTPSVAKRWLSRNVRNRAIRAATVAAYARDMAAGNWQITGEAVKFDTNGALADGQHRLNAVIQSGVSVPMLIVRGVDPEAQAVMDSGVKRAASDALTLRGDKFTPIVAAAARLALKEPAAGFVAEGGRIAVPTVSEIVSFVDAHPEVHRAAEMASRHYPSFDSPPSVLTLAWMRLEQSDLAATAEFFGSVANMTTTGPGDPRLALIRRLANARRNKERIEPRTHLSMIFRTWNAWRKGQPLNRLPADSRGSEVRVPSRLL